MSTKEYEQKVKDARDCDIKAGDCISGFCDDENFCKNFDHCRGKMGAASCTRGVCVQMQLKLKKELLQKVANNSKCRKAVEKMILNCIPTKRVPKWE